MPNTKLITRLIISVFILIFTTTAHADEEYIFDPDHTFVTWSVSHFDFSKVTGKFIAEGSLSFNPEKPQLSKLQITIPIASATTGIKKLDDTLQRMTYFYAEKHPTATFVSDKIKKTSKTTGQVSGTLTVRDISKPVVLNVTLTKIGKHAYFRRKAIGFRATTQLLRSDFGMRAFLPGVGDKVDIEIQAEAIIKPEPKGDSQ